MVYVVIKNGLRDMILEGIHHPENDEDKQA
jgi:hypothetical protein